MQRNQNSMVQYDHQLNKISSEEHKELVDRSFLKDLSFRR